MIPAEIRYKAHDGKLLAIIEVFKIWKYYLCNVMITGPTVHELHVIFLATAMSSSLYRLIVATTLLSYLRDFASQLPWNKSCYDAYRSNQ